MSPSDNDPRLAPIERLVRTHNLAIFAVFAAALGSIMCVQATHAFPTPPRWIWATRAALILLPLASLVATAAYTRRAIGRLGPGPAPDAILAAFARSKRLSLRCLTVCGLAAALSLIAGHTVVDVLLAGISFALLLATRPSAAGLATFAHITQDPDPEPRETDAPA